MKIDKAADLDTACDIVEKYTSDRSIVTVFKRKAKGKITHSSQPHSKFEMR